MSSAITIVIIISSVIKLIIIAEPSTLPFFSPSVPILEDRCGEMAHGEMFDVNISGGAFVFITSVINQSSMASEEEEEGGRWQRRPQPSTGGARRRRRTSARRSRVICNVEYRSVSGVGMGWGDGKGAEGESGERRRLASVCFGCCRRRRHYTDPIVFNERASSLSSRDASRLPVFFGGTTYRREETITRRLTSHPAICFLRAGARARER